MAKRFHTNINGEPAVCHAESDETCPRGQEGMPHGDSPEEVQQKFEDQNESRENKTLSKAKKKAAAESKPRRKMSAREQELLDQNKKLTQRVIQVRSDAGDITYDDANPERAERRLTEAVEYANSRGNTHLSDKLTKAKVLPSGAFKTADGKRVNTDKLLQQTQSIKHLESERGKIQNEMDNVIRNAPPNGEKFSVKRDSGTYTVSVKEGTDDEEFEKLDEKTKAKISSDRDSYSMDEARERIPQEKLDKITTNSQVIDYVVGKKPDTGEGDINADTNLKGNDSDEKLQSGATKVADLYESYQKQNGYARDVKASTKEGNEAIKSAASTQGGGNNTFAPARSQKNGALVSGRQSINRKEAEKVLSESELKSITVKKPAPDKAKAEKVLSSEQFDKIFKAKKASIRVTEAKN